MRLDSPFRASRLGLAAILTLLPAAHAVAQSQSYKTGYGRVQAPQAATRQAPSSGLSLTGGTLLATGAVAVAVGLGLALAGTGDDGDDDASPSGGGGNVVGTGTR